MFRIKDFEIRGFRCGSRLQGGPEWAYKIVYHAPSGKSVTLDKICYRKQDAQRYIRETVKAAEALKRSKEG